MPIRRPSLRYLWLSVRHSSTRNWGWGMRLGLETAYLITAGCPFCLVWLTTHLDSWVIPTVTGTKQKTELRKCASYPEIAVVLDPQLCNHLCNFTVAPQKKCCWRGDRMREEPQRVWTQNPLPTDLNNTTQYGELALFYTDHDAHLGCAFLSYFYGLYYWRANPYFKSIL